MKLPLEGRWLGLIVLLAAGFAGLIALAFHFVRLPTPLPTAPRTTPPASIGITRLDGATSNPRFLEQALLDPDPLFLPTALNASQLELARYERQPGTAQQPIGAKYLYGDDVATMTLPDPLTVPAEPAQSLYYGRAQNPYELLGRFAREEPPLSARAAFLEVIHAKTGRVVLTAPLTVPNPPPAIAGGDWSPLELMAAVDATGLIGQPTLSRGSGVEAIDGFFRGFLAKTFHLGERLPAGFYLLRVGP